MARTGACHGLRHISSILLLSIAISGGPAGAQSVSGSFRTRAESWGWFTGDASGDYEFSGSLLRVGVGQSTKRVDWQIEFALPMLLGVPGDAIAAGAQGQLGLGATYFAANGGQRNDAELFVKQGFVRFQDAAGVAGQSVKAGRMEFADGAEVAPKHATLAALKRDRIAQRLVGTFGFTHVGRSFDGVQYGFDRPSLNVTALAARPTRGVFQVNGWGELNVNVYYGALTRPLAGGAHTAEWRVFGLDYRDHRGGVLKTDNRPLAARRADTSGVHVFTLGGHFIDAVTTRAGVFDVLLWGAGQRGSWGVLSHRASAIAVEGGWQPSAFARLRPWIRGGYNAGSGDGNPGDTRHGTFFQVLPTPRIYARFPFFNMMNTGDAFGELVLRPSPRLTVRADGHALRLSDANDLWYAGGGAFQPATFGFTGRPSNGHRGLAALYDASVDFALDPRATISGYYGYAAGGRVVDAIYPKGAGASFGYVELTLRF